MKCMRLAGLAAFLVVGGALAGCHHNHHQGPHYGGWGGCFSQETDPAAGRAQPSWGRPGGCCSHGECREEVVHGGADGVPMVPAGEGGHPLWTQPSNGAGLR
ncbi:MAG TPA: hypothetical protein VML55_14765 [Planctomycetaceae bacterium]|nr:hypothetical protein [Planctomycetaceae bacterium]